ncbi:ferredoxin-2, mitochondrial [Caerostris extrusa]|uniref:Ferredoxin-2, mitochondrial n=1 Tax=Caerostris extrusa TaxID=172846 RepID=A0AAV4TLI5_CAEEX|nr:ferredoxin-2, mitochondrial [Caerostris extrusa]
MPEDSLFVTGDTNVAKRNCAKSADTYEIKTLGKEEKVKFYFLFTKTGEKIEVEGKVGQNVMEVGLANDVEMEGACEGTLACTTCHVYVEERIKNILPKANIDEEDLLDRAPYLKSNSRLSCQIKVTKDIKDAVFLYHP